MTAGATEENADLGWVAAWTHSTSWNVTAISTDRAWYRCTPGATWRRVSGVLSVIVGHYLFFPTASISFPHSLQLPGNLFSLPFSLFYFLSPSIHPCPSCCFLTFSDTRRAHLLSNLYFSCVVLFWHSPTVSFFLVIYRPASFLDSFLISDFSKISCFFLTFLNVQSFYHNASVFLFTITNFLTDLYCTKKNIKRRKQNKMQCSTLTGALGCHVMLSKNNTEYNMVSYISTLSIQFLHYAFC